MPVTRHPPYRSVHEELPHTAPTSGDNAEIFCVHHQDRSTQLPAPVCGPRQCSWCSPWSTPFPPPAPQRFSPHCSLVSQVLCCCPTSVSRSYQSYGISPSLVVPFSRKNSRISRFPCKRCPHMPGSKTPPGRPVTRIYATARVAFPSGPRGRHPRAGDFGAQ